MVLVRLDILADLEHKADIPGGMKPFNPKCVY
jgi:hypothetical protein